VTREKADAVLFALVIVAFGLWWFYLREGATGLLDAFARAIYDFEGSGAGTLATRNNNPGNLRPPNGGLYWPGQTGVASGGYAIFQTFTDGWNALISDIQHKVNTHPEWTIQDFFNVWLGGAPGVSPPAAEGNAVNYAKYVADRIGAAVTSTLGSLFGKG